MLPPFDHTVTGKGPGPILPQNIPECVDSWLHTGKIYNTSPSDLESMFIEAGDTETKERLKIEDARS